MAEPVSVSATESDCQSHMFTLETERKKKAEPKSAFL